MSKPNATETKTVKRGQGRPMKEITWPVAKFTRGEICALNAKSCEPLTVQKHMDWDMYSHAKNSKGEEIGFPNVDKNTLHRNSVIVRLKELREPKNKSGLGRKQFVYLLRAKLAEFPDSIPAPAGWTPAKAVKTPATPKVKTKKGGKKAKTTKTPKAKKNKVLTEAETSTVTVPVLDVTSPETTAYEAQKASLLAPTVAPEIPAEPAPAAPEVPAETAPVSEVAPAEPAIA